jgi:hypothetical protein
MHSLLAVPAVEGDLTGRGAHSALHARDVSTGAEALAGAGQYQRLDGLVRGDLFERDDELATHVVAHRVALVGRLKVIVAIEASILKSISMKFMMCLRFEWPQHRSLGLDVVFLDDLSPPDFFGFDVSVELGGDHWP